MNNPTKAEKEIAVSKLIMKPYQGRYFPVFVGEDGSEFEPCRYGGWLHVDGVKTYHPHDFYPLT